jgi:hypothetical protein
MRRHIRTVLWLIVSGAQLACPAEVLGAGLETVRWPGNRALTSGCLPPAGGDNRGPKLNCG